MTTHDFPVPLRGAKAPTLMWAHEHDVEPQALQQLRNIAALPWVEGVRVMPDVHLGKGATVGSVIAMRDAVSPNAVGVDIGCVDAETEYLSPAGWRRIDEYDGGKVMQYDPASGEARFVDPLRYIVKDADTFLHFKTKYGIDQMLTPDHKVLAWKITGRDRRREMVVLSAAELAEIHGRLVQGAKYEIKTTFTPALDTRVPLTDDEIRLHVAVTADASLPARETKATVRLVKARKIARLRSILERSGTAYTERLADNGVTTFRFVPPLPRKGFESFWACSLDQLHLIAHEVLLWDGNAEAGAFFTRRREEADFVQYVFAATGHRAVMRADVHASDGETDYRVFANPNSMVGLAGVPKSPITEIPASGSKAYCFTLPSGFWVMRRGGNVAVTGNCGMVGVRTSLRLEDLPDDLAPLRAAFERAVPVGFSGHDRALDIAKVPSVSRGTRDSRLMQSTTSFWDQFSALHPGVHSLEDRARKQLGTLGGGNHFIELCSDDDGYIWLQLHSGSRNIGKSVAEVWIGKAKGLDHNLHLPDRDLAVFLKGTPEMDGYLADLTWAQEYAARSRDLMIRLIVDEVRKTFSALGKDVAFEQVANCFAGETAVLTRNGVRPIRELVGSHHELLTTGGEWVKAPVEHFGEQELYEVTVGRYGQEKVIRATAGHRWLLRAKVAHNRTEDVTTGLRVGDRLDYAFPARVADLKPSKAGVARGFVFGDGATSSKNRSRAFFCGPKDEALLPFFEGLSPNAPRFNPRSTGVWTLAGLPGEWKRELPALDGNRDDLYGWVAGYFAADGDVDETGRPTIASMTRAHLEHVKSVCNELGIGTYPIRDHASNETSYNGLGATSYLMGFMRADLDSAFFVLPAHRERFERGRAAIERRGWTVRSVRRTGDVEDVYCAVVEGTHAFTLEDNILVGNCHHNYVAVEQIDGAELIVTRKGAIRAGKGDIGLIPGSMGTGSYIVRGLGNTQSYQSASHGAGRRMSRSEAKRRFTVEDLAAQTAGVECRKDQGVVDEIPGAYKDLAEVIAAQSDLVEVVTRLTTLLCVKG